MIFTRNKNIHRTHKDMDDGRVSAVHFGPTGTPVKLVFLHANGFNGLAYRSILEGLGVHVIALDLRGHGMTTLPAQAGQFANFYSYAQDVIAYVEAHISGEVVLAGHSLGASTAILAAGIAPDKITKVLAFDPIVLPLFVRGMMSTKMGRRYLVKNFPMARAAGKRRDIFNDFQTVFKRYQGRGTFKHFPDTALWDYICGGFVKDGDHVRLACRPAWEQYTYVAQSHDLKKAIKALPVGSHLMVTDFVKQGKWIAPMGKFRPDMQTEHLPDYDHFFPLINPDISIAALQNILAND